MKTDAIDLSMSIFNKYRSCTLYLGVDTKVKSSQVSDVDRRRLAPMILCVRIIL